MEAIIFKLSIKCSHTLRAERREVKLNRKDSLERPYNSLNDSFNELDLIYDI